MEDNVRKRVCVCVCVCDWVALLYSRKLTGYCKLAITEKIKSLKNLRNNKNFFKSLQITNAEEGVEKRESSYTVGGNVS